MPFKLTFMIPKKANKKFSTVVDMTFASKYIRIRAFHNAISRSCILLRFHTNRRKTINNW